MQKVIFLTQQQPTLQQGGGSLRDTSLLGLLGQIASTHIVCHSLPTGSTAVSFPNVSVTSVAKEKSPWFRKLHFLFRTYVVNGYSTEIIHALQQVYTPGSLLWVSRLAMAKYIPAAKKMGYKVILDEHNVESDLLLFSARKNCNLYAAFLALQCLYYEQKFCKASSAVCVTSNVDQKKIASWNPSQLIQVIPNLIQTKDYNLGHTKKIRALFPGTLDYAPNIEAVDWLVNEIVPALQKISINPVEILVAGARPSEALVQKLHNAGIGLVANPASMLPLLSESAVVIVPLLSGSGTRLKILEAMAAGCTVLSTTKGAEGLDAVNHKHLEIADTAEAFASNLVDLMNNSKKRDSLSTAALEFVQKTYDVSAGLSTLKNLLSTVGQQRKDQQK